MVGIILKFKEEELKMFKNFCLLLALIEAA